MLNGDGDENGININRSNKQTNVQVHEQTFFF